MTTIQRIGYDSPAYRAGLALRDRVMRQPLGLSIYDEDFSFEKDCVLLAAFDEDGSLTGFGSMTNAGPVRRIEYLCVDPDFQGEGIGRRLLARLEALARDAGAETVQLDARVSAQAFYENMGYHTAGEVFTLSYAPVPHILMEKSL